MKKVYKGIALGSESFIEGIKDKIIQAGNEREIRETHIAVNTAEDIINTLANKYAITRKAILLKKRGNVYRQLAMCLVKEHTALGLREIGDLFDMDYAAVSQACKRFEAKIQADKAVSNLKKGVEADLKREMSNVET